MARTKQKASDEASTKIESVACYIRVSTEEQAMHGISLAAQEEKLRTYAENNNMRIVEWYKDEGVSGRKEIRKRPELQRMIQDAEQGKFERIIFIKLDRFFRSVAEYHECMKRIDPVVWTTTEEKYDQTTANGRFFINAKLAIAEMEADQTGERIDMVNEYKVATGQPLGNVPLGYIIVNDLNTGRKKIVKDPEKENMIYDMIEHFRTYQSRRQTTIYINEKYGLRLKNSTVANLLKNALLCGEYRNNPAYISEPYIDKKTFDDIQEILLRNIKHNTTKRFYIFSGLIVCPECKHPLSGMMYQSKTRKTKEKTYTKVYRCCKHTTNKTCVFCKQVIETTLEKLMLENVERFFEEIKVETVKIQDSQTFKMPQITINEINERIDRLNYSWQTGKIRTAEQYEKQYSELAKQLEEVMKTQNDVVVKDFSKIEFVLKAGWKDIYNALDDEHKRAFWRSFVKSIELDWDGKVKKIAKINFI